MSKRNIIRIAGIATAVEPIIHGGERSGGTVTEFRREKVLVDGVFEYLPSYSANAVAGLTRDNCAFWCLDQLPNFEQFTDLRAFDLLTGGGNLVAAKGDKYVNLFEEADLREMFPVISLFGGSIGNRILGGRVDFSAWSPICEEWSAYLPDHIKPLAQGVYMADLLQILNWTRRDDKKNRAMQDLIEPETLAAWQRENAGRAEKGDAGSSGEAMSMRYGYEALAIGTQLYVEITLRNPTPVELGVLFGGLSYFYERPKIGGRGARGCGRVKLDLHQYKVTGPAQIEEPLALDSMTAAAEHLQQREAQILEAFRPGAL